MLKNEKELNLSLSIFLGGFIGVAAINGESGIRQILAALTAGSIIHLAAFAFKRSPIFKAFRGDGADGIDEKAHDV